MTEDRRPNNPETDAAAGAEPKSEYVASSPAMAFVRRHIWPIGIAFGLLMITGTRNCLIKRPPAPPAIAQLVDANLVDQDGAPFSLGSMKGQVWVVGFIFTRCPTTCPQVARSMLEFQKMVRDSRVDEHVSLLTVTVDPEHDTPAVLREYAAKLGANPENWRFVTGGTDEVTRFVVDGFKTAVGERREQAPGVFDIAHSTRLALVDRAGAIRGFYSTEEWNEQKERLYHAMFPVIRLREGQ